VTHPSLSSGFSPRHPSSSLQKSGSHRSKGWWVSLGAPFVAHAHAHADAHIHAHAAAPVQWLSASYVCGQADAPPCHVFVTDTNGHFVVTMVLPNGSPLEAAWHDGLKDSKGGGHCSFQLRVYNTTRGSYLKSPIFPLFRQMLDHLYAAKVSTTECPEIKS
jgi:hypothetical protein